MKQIRLAVAAALILSAAPMLAHAQGGRGNNPTAPGQNTTGSADIDREQDRQREARGRRSGRAAKAAPAADLSKTRPQAMAAAPALVAAARISCTPADAAVRGQTKAADGTMNSVYELSCAEGPGYILMAKADMTLTDGYECFALKSGNEALVAAGTPNPNALTCNLAANADPLAGFRRIAQAAVPGCTIDEARYLGAVPSTKEFNYEVGCAGRPGVILALAGPGGTPKAPTTTPCERIPAAAKNQCQFTTKTEALTPISTLVAGSGRTCQVADGRYVGDSATSQESFFEAKCSDGKGFMVVANANGSFNRAIDCARAGNVAGGCTLTDSVEALNQEAGLYKDLATKAGFACDVGQYRLMGVEQATKREVVELACKERPEGVIAFFPVAGAGKADFYDCTKVAYRKLDCKLTKPEATYPRLTTELQGKGRNCQVTGVRGVGIVASRSSEFVEVACASGPGFMMEYVAGPAFGAPKTVIPCSEATEIGDGCKLAAAASNAARR
jgi:hypothetical protein